MVEERKRLPMRIEWFMWQPFESRHGELIYAVALRNTRWRDRSLFASLLRVLKAKHTALGGLSVSRRNHQSGGWLPTWHRWFVEPVVWPEVVDYYQCLGVEIREVAAKGLGDLRLEAIRSDVRRNMREFGTPEPSSEQVRASYASW
jgi:hypothetical protein|tara:strand:- start:566 stop:1003 length:438 start_codon:yes stop_codon:yes gene_type:complete